MYLLFSISPPATTQSSSYSLQKSIHLIIFSFFFVPSTHRIPISLQLIHRQCNKISLFIQDHNRRRSSQHQCDVGWVGWKMREYYKMGEGQSYRNQFDCCELKRYGYSASRGPSCASIDWCSITCSEFRSKYYLTVSHLLPKLSPSLELKTSTANPFKRLERHLRPTLFFWRSTLIAVDSKWSWSLFMSLWQKIWL